MASSHNANIRFRVGLVAGLLLTVFFAYFDLTQPPGVAAGIAYVAVVAIGLLAQSSALVVLFGSLGIVLTVAGYFTTLPESSVEPFIALLNRGLSLFALLTITITGTILIQRHERFDRQLMELASTDALTRLLNRRVLLEEAVRRVEEARRYGNPLSALMIDIDHFKSINDRYGHLAGDKVLRKVARTAQSGMRRTDYLGRYGGEEFLLICPNTDAEEAAILAERIRSATEALGFTEDGLPEKVSVSIGVAELLMPDMGLRGLVDAADRGLYRAKRNGRNRVVVEVGAIAKKQRKIS